MTTIHITLPDQLVQDAQRAGRLAPSRLERLLRNQLESQRVDDLFSAIGRMMVVEEPGAMSPEEVAREIATSVSPRSVGIMKKQIYSGQMQDFAGAYDDSLEEMAAGFSSEDFKEGVAHFIEKRVPRFSGR